MTDPVFRTLATSPVAAMASHRPGPCNLVIFGATGDLAKRKLIPALYELARAGALPDRYAVIGVSRGVGAAAGFRAALRESTARFARSGPLDDRVWDGFAARVQTVAGAADDPETYARLRDALAAAGKRHGSGESALYYLSVPSSVSPEILGQLSGAGLIRPPGLDPWSRVIIEKPFGHDLASARAHNAQTAATLDEAQVLRIDHYLGKETVQNILVFRFGNAIFEPLWNSHYVDHVQITAAESIGIEGRGRFYEETGVVRDIVQNHLLQVLALCAMEPPISFQADEIRDMKAQVLRAIRPLGDDAFGQSAVFAQYDGYRDERGVAPESRTPTYAAMALAIDNWRWQGVPFYVRAGKALARRNTEVRVTFKPIPHCLFGAGDVCARLEPNVLTLRIQPDDGIGLRFASKVPGEDFSVAGVDMDFSYAEGFSKQAPEAYERLLLDAMRGDATLFARRDEVEQAWRVVDPLLRRWESDADLPLPTYVKGSQGPREADAMLARGGRRWERL